MSIAIISQVKNEELYINEWISYHLNLGFDKFILGDNNDDPNPRLENSIDDRFKSYVKIIDVRNKPKNQCKFLEETYDSEKSNFDFICSIDIDEFVVLRKDKTIQDFIKRIDLDKNNVVRLNWRIFGDDDKIVDDVSKPVVSRFNKTYIDSNYAKSIFKTNEYLLDNPHFPKINQTTATEAITPSGLKCKSWNSIDKIDTDIAYVAHYRTKSLDEFVRGTLLNHRGTNEKKEIDIMYYFVYGVNRMTKDKMDYILNIKKEYPDCPGLDDNCMIEVKKLLEYSERKTKSKTWVMHWFIVDRNNISLTNIEQFHFNIFKSYKEFIEKEIDTIIVSFAKTSKTSNDLINYLACSFKSLFLNNEIIFQLRENNQKVGEFETFRDNVLMNLDINGKVLYTHMKGVYRTIVAPQILQKELSWILQMYQVVFNKCSIDALDNSLMSGPDISIYDNAFNSIKTGKWNPETHINKTYISPLKSNLLKCKHINTIDKFIELLPNMNDRKPWAYLGTFYWIDSQKLNKYLTDCGLSKSNLIEISNEFQKYERPFNMNNAVSNLNGNVVRMTFANNVSEYLLPSVVDKKKCSFFAVKNNVKK